MAARQTSFKGAGRENQAKYMGESRTLIVPVLDLRGRGMRTPTLPRFPTGAFGLTVPTNGLGRRLPQKTVAGCNVSLG